MFFSLALLDCIRSYVSRGRLFLSGLLMSCRCERGKFHSVTLATGRVALHVASALLAYLGISPVGIPQRRKEDLLS